ncbi:hypothetical protein CCACVL1_14230 [Corchorus capsularis]|uniref:Uncharacterized protein n=1 Tax=Corchorus capsularis TaxID=210143 RepID=A0A1R3I823_COCAP|nr:hypothetical protein CCACVL1_14230 [Corchorus capsularis]
MAEFDSYTFDRIRHAPHHSLTQTFT